MLNFFKKYDVLLKWWFIFILSLTGFVILGMSGMIDRINNGDITKITFVILTLFFMYSINTGRLIYKFCQKDSCNINDIETIKRENESGWFAAETLLTLGLFGTVVGFIYMLSMDFGSFNMESLDVTNLRSALITMIKGMSTALYTTASGLICSLILKIQLFLFNQNICKRSPFKED